MTPRQADVAFVLESVRGVNAVYAIAPGRRASAYFDFAVELEPGGRILAEAHYALLRVLDHEDCARVFLFHATAPALIGEAARLIELAELDREAARQRVPLRIREEPRLEVRTPAAEPTVLVVDSDEGVEAVVREELGAPTRWVVQPRIEGAVKLATERSFDLVLCDARLAFGQDGLLARVPLDDASRVLVLTTPSEFSDARWRLKGAERILTRPLERWVLRERLTRVGAVNVFRPADLKTVVAAAPRKRRLEVPPASAPFTVLLTDVNDEVHDALRRIVREDARQIIHEKPEQAAEIALSTPFHVLLASARAVLHRQSFLDGIAREDPAGADRVLVVAPLRDVPYLKHKVSQMGRKNTVLALPIDDTILRREVFREHPGLVAKVAVADIADAAAPRFPLLRFRRLSVLVVDDDPTTAILLSAAGPHAFADVALATTSLEAFEHVVSRPIDVLVVSATMRADGAEPIYRLLWRLKPELKSRSVLVMAPDVVPASAARSDPPRIVERPVTRAAIERVVAAFKGA